MWFLSIEAKEPLLKMSEVLPFPTVTVGIHIECIYLELLVYHLH
jgi:hypothetical protein